jgi:hypothetical protein
MARVRRRSIAERGRLGVGLGRIPSAVIKHCPQERLCPVPSIIERSPTRCVRLRGHVSSPMPERKYCISRHASRAERTISIGGQAR